MLGKTVTTEFAVHASGPHAQSAQPGAHAGRLLERLEPQPSRTTWCRLRSVRRRPDRTSGRPRSAALPGTNPRHGWRSTAGHQAAQRAPRHARAARAAASPTPRCWAASTPPRAARARGSRSAARRGGTGSRTAAGAALEDGGARGWARASSSCRRSSPASPTAQETVDGLRRRPQPRAGVARAPRRGCRTRCATTSSARADRHGGGRPRRAAALADALPRAAARACWPASTRCSSRPRSARRRCAAEGHTGDPLLCRAWTLPRACRRSASRAWSGPAGMPIGVQLVGRCRRRRCWGRRLWVEGALARS